MKKVFPTFMSMVNSPFYLLAILMTISLSCFSQNVGISANGATPPNAAAGLDINFTNKGLLIPRVSLDSTTDTSPLSAHVAGMIVYNTETENDITPGLYYNNGTKWVRTVLNDGTTSGDMQYWNDTTKTWVNIAIGAEGQKLTLTAGGIPAWSN